MKWTSETAEQFYSFGFSQYRYGNWQKAAEVFSHLCDQNPLTAKYWFGLGASLQEGKEYPKALKAWAITALLDRFDPYPHFHAAECALSLQNRSDARLALKEAEERIGTSSHPLKDRIEVLRLLWNIEASA